MWAKRVLLSVLAFTLSLLLIECGLRLFRFRYDASLFTKDPVLGWSLRPGAEGWNVSEGEAYIRINRHGFRDIERTVEKPANTYRIAVLGDSVVEARQVQLEDTFCALAEKRLANCPTLGGRRVEVLNFGVPGYGTAQELLLLETRIWEYKPDFVVLCVYLGNDLVDNGVRNVPFRPYFFLKDGALVFDDSFRKHRLVQAASIRKEYLLAEIMNHSRLLLLLNQVRIRWRLRHSRPSNAAQAGLIATDDWATLPYRPPKQQSEEEMWRVTEVLLLRMRDEVLEHGAKFLLMSAPMERQIHPDVKVREAFARQLGIENLYFSDEWLEALSQKNHFPLLVLSRKLGVIAARDAVFLNGFKNTPPGQGHLNELGHQAVAEELTQTICGGIGAKQ